MVRFVLYGRKVTVNCPKHGQYQIGDTWVDRQSGGEHIVWLSSGYPSLHAANPKIRVDRVEATVNRCPRHKVGKGSASM